MKLQIEKWNPIENRKDSDWNIKSINDNYNGLTVTVENNAFESFNIKWTMVESYCCSTVRFRFIAGQWQQIRKEFPKWSFFKITDSPYIKWIKEQAGKRAAGIG